MEKYEKRLEKEEWGELYNKEQVEQVISRSYGSGILLDRRITENFARK